MACNTITKQDYTIFSLRATIIKRGQLNNGIVTKRFYEFIDDLCISICLIGDIKTCCSVESSIQVIGIDHK